MAKTSISSTTFIVQYYDYYGHLITTGLSSPTISTIIPSITYSATYSQVATLLSQSLLTSTNPSGPVILTALIDTASTTELQIVVLPTAAASNPSTTPSGPQPSQTSQITSGTSPATSSVTGKSHSFSRGAIAGIAIGIALALIALLVLGFCVVRRRRRRQPHPTPLRVPAEGTTNSSRFEKAELEAPTSSAEVGVQPVQELPASVESNVTDGPGDGPATKSH